MGSQTGAVVSRPKKRIRDEILYQIGKSILLVFVLIAVVAVFMMWQAITSSKKTELTLESQSAADSVTSFLEPYIRISQQMAVNPEVAYVLSETKPGDYILDTDKMDTVHDNLVNIAQTDSENIMAVWISDLDTSSLTQSDGFTSEEGWDITGRAWYPCIETGETILTEPYVDSSTEKLILSTATPVYDPVTGEVLGAAGVDISLDHFATVMSKYKMPNFYRKTLRMPIYLKISSRQLCRLLRERNSFIIRQVAWINMELSCRPGIPVMLLSVL